MVGTFGLKGFLKVWPDTDFPERFEPGRSVFIGDISHEILELQWHKLQARIRVKGVRRLAEAEALIGLDVSVPADDVPELGEGEFMVGDLIGMEVFDEAGRLLGTLDEVISAPAQDVYRVGELLIPAVSEFVLNVDLDAKRVVVRLIPGMLQ